MIRMFWSTDISGSTSYKTKQTLARDTGWPKVFRNFFSEYPRIAAEEISKSSMAEPRIWKFVGDEIILTSEPAAAEEVTLLLFSFFKAMIAYEEQFLRDVHLRLKGTAWLACFPTPNIEVEVPDRSRNAVTTQIDYIGPDIDLGFRLTQFACPSTVTLSLDLVETVLNAANHELLDFFYAGDEQLKGILFGKPYPLIWARPRDERDRPNLREPAKLVPILKKGPADPASLLHTIRRTRHYPRVRGLEHEDMPIDSGSGLHTANHSERL